MAEHDLESHAEHADQLRARVAEKGLTERERRLGALDRVAGGRRFLNRTTRRSSKSKRIHLASSSTRKYERLGMRRL